MRIVLDTNIMVSAMGWKEGKPRRILDSCINKENQLLESIDLIQEFIKVIARPMFDFVPRDEKKGFINIVLNNSTIVEPVRKMAIVKDDPADNKVIECAVEGKADYIISGDKHLLKLKKFKNIGIVTSEKFLTLDKT